MLKKPIVTVAAVVAAMFGSLLLTAPSASAYGACAGKQGSVFDGYGQMGHPEHEYEGASAYIVVREGSRCTGVNDLGNFVDAWVMITNQVNPAAWGQVGFERSTGDDAYSDLRWFSQFNDGKGHIDTRYSTFTVTNQLGVKHTFRTLWNSSCACLKATIDSTTWDSSNFNPYNAAQSTYGPQPWSPQFAEEAGYPQSDVPGSSTKRTAFTAMGAQRASDDALESMPCILSVVDSVPSRWSHSASSCIAADLWTANP